MNGFNFKKVLRENISSREEQNAPVFGLNSTDNDESLLNMLEKSTLTPEQQTELISLMMHLSKEHGVVLEQDLTGLRSERDRVIPAKPVLDFLEKINLNNNQKKSVVRILDKWGRFNSVRFDMKGAKQAPTTTQSKPEVSQNDKQAASDRIKKYIDSDKKAPAKNQGPFQHGQMQPGDEEVEIVPAGQEYTDAGLNADDEFERAETEEIPRPVSDVDVCAGLLDSLKKADPKLFDSMQDDDTIRGAIANFANDLSFTADAVVVSALGAAAAIPPAAPFFGAIAAGGTTVARAGAAVAVAMDLALLNGKDALIDSIGLIPWGKWISKGLGRAGAAVTKAGEKASREAIQKLLKTAGKAVETTAESGIKNLEKTLAEKIFKAAPKLGQEGAESAAKAIMTAVEQRIQTKLKSGGYGKGAPDPNKFKNPKEYKRALKSWQEARKEALEGEYKNCFRKDNLEVKNKALNLINAANEYVDDFPEAFDAVIGKGIDAVMWAKEFIFSDDDPMDAPPALAAQSNKNLNEQKYIMLLERFNIK